MNQTITTKEMEQKLNQKFKDCYQLNEEYFLLQSNEANHHFISDVISGKRKVPKSC